LTRLTLLICADIVELLIGDDLVCMDKIGTSNFYWSLTSEHANKARRKRRGARHEKTVALLIPSARRAGAQEARGAGGGAAVPHGVARGADGEGGDRESAAP
jgi:hypothetical protein